MDTSAALRELVAAHRPQTANVGYPAAVRERVRLYAMEQRQLGRTAGQIGAEIGLCRTTLSGWTRTAPGTAKLVPVAVVADAHRGVVPRSGGVLVSPRGYRVEGLDVVALAALLQAVG